MKGSIISDILHGGGKPEEEDVQVEEKTEDLGPCASRSTNKLWPGFHVKRAQLIGASGPSRLTSRSFDYSHMGFREYDPGNEWFEIEINEPEKWKIRVEGRALWKIYNYLHQNRLEWIQPAVGNAERGIPDGVPAILRITIQRIEDETE